MLLLVEKSNAASILQRTFECVVKRRLQTRICWSITVLNIHIFPTARWSLAVNAKSESVSDSVATSAGAFWPRCPLWPKSRICVLKIKVRQRFSIWDLECLHQLIKICRELPCVVTNKLKIHCDHDTEKSTSLEDLGALTTGINKSAFGYQQKLCFEKTKYLRKSLMFDERNCSIFLLSIHLICYRYLLIFQQIIIILTYRCFQKEIEVAEVDDISINLA